MLQQQRGRVLVGVCVGLVLAVALVADLSLGQATSRKMMNLQGRLTDTEGSPTTGPHLFELRIFDAGAAGSGNQLYYEAQRVEVNKGIYNVLVGDGYSSFTGDDPDSYAVAGGQTGGIPASVFNRDDLWLEIEIDEDNPLDPRTRVVSSAYAFNADTLDGKDSDDFLQQGDDGQLGTLSFVGGGEMDSAKVAAIDSLLNSPGGLIPRGYDDSPDSGTNFTGTVQMYSVTNFTKQAASSKLRVTFSDTIYHDNRDSQDCVFQIEWRPASSGGWNRTCRFFWDHRADSRQTGNGSRAWWWGGTHHWHDVSDSWTRQLPLTHVCVQASLGAGNYDVRIVGWRDSSGTCYYDRHGDGFLIVDEMF